MFNKDLVLVLLDIGIWGGDTVLRKGDIRLGAGGQLPPHESHTLGRKFIIDKKKLKPFDNIKRRTKAVCNSFGMESMGGYAIPSSCQHEFIPMIDALSQEYNQVKQHFLSNYAKWIEDWANNPFNKGFAENIRAAMVPVDKVKESFSFEYRTWEISPSSEVEKTKMKKDLGNLEESLLQEIADTVSNFLVICAKRESSFLARSLQPLFSVRKKVDSLKFLGPQFGPLLALFDNALAGLSVSTSGTVSGSLFYQVIGSINMLSSREQIEGFLERGFVENPDPLVHLSVQPTKPKQVNEKQESLFSQLDLSDVESRLSQFLKSA